MPAPTDYHETIRDAIATAIGTALTDAGFGSATLPVETLDDVEQLTKVASLPCVAVCPVAPEQKRDAMATNLRTGIGYPCLIALYTVGSPNVEKSPNAPDVTLFRRIVEVTFQWKRLSGVSQVGWCEVSPNPVEFDRESPAFSRLSSGLVVVAVGRFPRS